jgi:hypothetical protein
MKAIVQIPLPTDGMVSKIRKDNNLNLEYEVKENINSIY